MAKTGIKIKRCNVGSVEAHNERSQEYLDGLKKAGLPIYFYPNLSGENRSWVNPQYQGRSCAQIFEEQKKLYRDKVGQDPQLADRTFIDKKTGKEKTRAGWSPIREGVIPIKEETTIDDFSPIVSWARNHGLNVIRIDIHRDEGHIDAITGDFKPNRHAHIVFDWLDWRSGKTIKLNANHMSELQTLIAEALDMERGEISDKKHIPNLEFKAKMAEEECKKICREMVDLMADKDDLKAERNVLQKNIREQGDVLAQLGEKSYNLEYAISGSKREQVVLRVANGEIKREMFNATEALKKTKKEMVAEINASLNDYPKKGMFESEKTYMERCEKFNEKVVNKVLGVWGELDNPIKEFINLPGRVVDAIESGWRRRRNERREMFESDATKQSYLDLRRMHPQTFALLEQMNYQGLEEKEKSALLKGDAMLIKKSWHDPDDGHWSEECAAHVSVVHNELRFDGLSIREFFRQVLSALKSKVKKIVGGEKAQKEKDLKITPRQEEEVERRSGRRR